MFPLLTYTGASTIEMECVFGWICNALRRTSIIDFTTFFELQSKVRPPLTCTPVCISMQYNT
jgi:hypothetical protein